MLAHGGRVISVNSVDDAAKALAKIDSPIGTLYFVTHSTSDGALKFGKDEGFTKAADIAAKPKGSVPSDKAPQTVDFRGCSVGNSPQAMEEIAIPARVCVCSTPTTSGRARWIAPWIT